MNTFKPKNIEQAIKDAEEAINDDVIDDIFFYIYDGRYLQAVKRLRETNVMGLKDCKECLDRIKKRTTGPGKLHFNEFGQGLWADEFHVGDEDKARESIRNYVGNFIYDNI